MYESMCTDMCPNLLHIYSFLIHVIIHISTERTGILDRTNSGIALYIFWEVFLSKTLTNQWLGNNIFEEWKINDAKEVNMMIN